MSFNLISIDPGNNTGITVFNINAVTLEINFIESSTYTLNSYIDEESNTKLLDRCMYLNKLLLNYLNYYNPLVIAYERAFMNVRFPNSIIQLSNYINTIEMSIRKYDPWIKVLSYPPKYIKKYVGAGGEAMKDDMKTNLSRISEISSKINLDNLTEHSIDSISIGYVGLNEVRQYNHMLWSL